MNGMINESITGHMLIKAFNGEEEVLGQFDEKNQDLSRALFKSQFFISVLTPFMDFVSNFTYVVVCLVSGIMIILGKMQIETIVAFILYIKMVTSNLTQIIQALGSIQPGIACGERIMEYLELEEETDEGRENVSKTEGDVVFRNVRFGYVEGQIVLKDFSAHIKPGMKVAIVGPTGAGKSTLINLLMRFYELNSGSIIVDGVPIKDIPRSKLHDLFAMVLQETWTFKGSIRENIVYSTKNVDDEELEGVIERAGIKSLVDAMPDGVDTVLSETANVSSGQKQLITIARAMLKNSPIMILDEATSSVDTRTEKLIQKAIDDMTKGHTSFVIAHRLSTIKNADVIFVLKDGDIVETGNHEELLDAGGFYSELYKAGLDAT
jgi:ATP-binding cassette subfamily B protein